MKKFLIGIVTLVAAVMFISPAFGSLITPWDWPDGNGSFSFLDKNGDKLDFARDPLRLDLHTSSPDDYPDVINNQWEPGTVDESTLVLFEADEGDFTGSSVIFEYPVEILTAKWGTYAYAFQTEGFTKTFSWNDDLTPGMSNVRGFNPVPVPAAVWLLGSGVLGLVAIRRRRSS